MKYSSTSLVYFKRGKGLPFPKDYILDKAKTNLHPKRDHLFRLLNRLGLRPRQLTTQELVQLFFEMYNPEVQGQILSTTQEYETPLVKPAAEFLEKAPFKTEPKATSPVSGAPPVPSAEPELVWCTFYR